MKRKIFYTLSLFAFSSFCITAIKAQGLGFPPKLNSLIQPMPDFSHVVITKNVNDSIPKVLNIRKNENRSPITAVNGVYIPLEASRYSVKAEDIVSLDVEKSTITEIAGVRYYGMINITLKEGCNPVWLSLNDVVEKYVAVKDANYVFSINDNLIDLPKDLKFVDERNILQIRVEKLNYLSAQNNFYSIVILTHTKENLDKVKPEIMIRGGEALGMVKHASPKLLEE